MKLQLILSTALAVALLGSHCSAKAVDDMSGNSAAPSEVTTKTKSDVNNEIGTTAAPLDLEGTTTSTSLEGTATAAPLDLEGTTTSTSLESTATAAPLDLEGTTTSTSLEDTTTSTSLESTATAAPLDLEDTTTSTSLEDTTTSTSLEDTTTSTSLEDTTTSTSLEDTTTSTSLEDITTSTSLEDITTTTSRPLEGTTTAKSKKHKVIAKILPTALAKFGNWGAWQFCPDGHFVNRFQLQVESPQGGLDDTALNSIRLYCSRSNNNQDRVVIHSSQGFWGHWKAIQSCNSGFFDGIQLRSEGPRGAFEDDTATNNVKMRCSNGRWYDGGGTNWGKWTSTIQCPAFSAVCGIKTQVEPKQGAGDDTALNGVAVACCEL